jgi:hypothetical protein
MSVVDLLRRPQHRSLQALTWGGEALRSNCSTVISYLISLMRHPSAIEFVATGIAGELDWREQTPSLADQREAPDDEKICNDHQTTFLIPACHTLTSSANQAIRRGAIICAGGKRPASISR